MASLDNNFDNRIGARQIVELLRFRCRPPDSKKIRLTPDRSRHAYAVLMDKLTNIQKINLSNGRDSSLVETLIDGCEEFEIALPVAEPDWGAILVLDELFYQLLSESTLDNDAKSWFSKLRLPIMRYVLMDYSFFFTSQNLVRRLLNQSYVIFLSNTEQNRLVYRDYLMNLSNKVVSEFRTDPGQFNSLCIEAQTFFASQKQKLELIESQLKVYETQKLKSKVAEQRVIKTLNQVMAEKKLPTILVEFLLNQWRQCLLIHSMKLGSDGNLWKRQVRVTESMVEFAEDCSNPKEREKFRNFYSVLIKNITSFLQETLTEPDKLEPVVEELELLFNALLQGVKVERVQTRLLQEEQSYVTEVSVARASAEALDLVASLGEGQWVRLITSTGHYEMSRITLKGDSGSPWVLISHNGKSVAKKNLLELALLYDSGKLEPVELKPWWNETVDSYFIQLQKDWAVFQQQEQQRRVEEERIRLEQEDAKKQAAAEHDFLSKPASPTGLSSENDSDQDLIDVNDEESSASESEYSEDHVRVTEQELETALQALDQIQIGGWITSIVANVEQRLKLAVKIKGRDKMVFVDRVGVKALEVHRHELARLLATGAVSIVDVGAQFDSTLERVVRNIQNSKH